ncbi:hypothetical protein [Alicyclobacillus macrosporangiidus]|uniref:Uncharacterized protein n=1 Tax=Alicyclobacillus macrosporangiidus TaxID=392015 RepID=A0A1I7KCX9_9BACL|nr:hypothetical protein [Alicyclobacillus macrosporangiidus]SFU95255.1 hypothetical protein SAMN05421543_11538 [Alicyclobacillus macrosporangiidus]
MSNDLLSLTHFVLAILMAGAAGFALVQTGLAGIAIISTSPQKKAEALGRVKWIVIGAILALSAYTLTALVSWEMTQVSGGQTGGSLTTSPPSDSQLIQLPGMTDSGEGIKGWLMDATFAVLAGLLDALAAIFWALTGFTGPAAMITANIWTPDKNDSWVMGIFSTQTWSAMMYVQHSLYALVAIAALISFVIQGIQIENAPSSAIAKERAATLAKNVVVAGLVLGLTPYALGLLNAGVSDLTQWVLNLSASHDQQLAPNSFWGFLFYDGTQSSADFIANLKLFAGTSSGSLIGNSLFNLLMSVVNLCMWVTYQWRRVVLAILITLMPLFAIGLVTGKRVDLIVHWWKEVTAYMLLPFVAALFLLIARVFIGI